MDYVIKVAVDCGAQINIPNSCDNLGCVPRAIGMAIALKKCTPELAPIYPLVIVIVTIESLMQNLMELSYCVENKIPILVLVFRRDSSSPYINVGVCGSLQDIRRLLCLKEEIRVISRHTSPANTAKITKTALKEKSLILCDCTSTFTSKLAGRNPSPIQKFIEPLPFYLKIGNKVNAKEAGAKSPEN